MSPRVGVDDLKKRKLCMLPGLELRTPTRPSSSQLLSECWMLFRILRGAIEETTKGLDSLKATNIVSNLSNLTDTNRLSHSSA